MRSIQLAYVKTILILSSIGGQQDCATTFILEFEDKKASDNGNIPQVKKNMVIRNVL